MAIAAPGIVLSQPTRQTRPSNMCEIATSSIESAITSREISEPRMPVEPIVTPSETEMVLNSIGVPPAARMPSLTCCGQLALVEVARHRLGPRRRDADDRPRQVFVGEPDRLQHRPRAGAVGAVGDRGGDALGGIGRAIVRIGHRGRRVYRRPDSRSWLTSGAEHAIAHCRRARQPEPPDGAAARSARLPRTRTQRADQPRAEQPSS